MKQKKDVLITLRTTSEEHETIKRLAEQNNMTLTTYILNQTLSNNAGIYTKEFRNALLYINDICISDMGKDPLSVEVLSQLKKEVHTLWQYLK